MTNSLPGEKTTTTECRTDTVLAVLPRLRQRFAALLGPSGTLDEAVIEAREAGTYGMNRPGYDDSRDSQFNIGRIEGSSGVIPICGYLHDGQYSASWCTAYQHINEDLAAMLAMGVQSIVLEVSSPGGAVGGLYATARSIYEARESVKVTAAVVGDACSAAYWLSAAADDVIAVPTSFVGSIGIIAEAWDDSKWLDKLGFDLVRVVSSQSPNKAPLPGTDDFEREMQALVDQTAAVFLSEVALFRGVSIEKVAADYGKGSVFVGQAAKDAGLVDQIAISAESFQSLFGDTDMRIKATAVANAGDDAREVNTAAELRAACPELVAQIEADAKAAGAATAAETERTRIAAILAVDVPDGVAVDRAAACADPKMTAGDFALAVLAAVKAAPKPTPKAPEKTNALAALFADGITPLQGADVDAGSGEKRLNVAGASFSPDDIKGIVTKFQRR